MSCTVALYSPLPPSAGLRKVFVPRELTGVPSVALRSHAPRGVAVAAEAADDVVRSRCFCIRSCCDEPAAVAVAEGRVANSVSDVRELPDMMSASEGEGFMEKWT